MTRQDWAIGDNIHFQPELFAEVRALLPDADCQIDFHMESKNHTF